MKTDFAPSLVEAVIVDSGTPVLMVEASHEVWFRSFRVKLSLTAKYGLEKQVRHRHESMQIQRNELAIS
jgi:hypothetical protein